MNSPRVYTSFLCRSSQNGVAGSIPTLIAIKWLLSSTPHARAYSILNMARYCLRVSSVFCLMLVRDEASGLMILAAQNCFLNFEDNWSQEVIECLLNLSNQLLAGPIKEVGNNMHLSSRFTLLARMTVLKVLRWLPGSVVPSYDDTCGSLKPGETVCSRYEEQNVPAPHPSPRPELGLPGLVLNWP